jgi:hypothetical protein
MSRNPLTRKPSVHPLSTEEIEESGRWFKEDLQREANRMVRRNNMAGAVAALEGVEYIDKFIYTLKVRAGSQLGLPARARPIHIREDLEANEKRAKKAKT